MSLLVFASGGHANARTPAGTPMAPGAPTPPAGMRYVPAGEFTMGSGENYAWPEERPAHRVRLTKAFFLDDSEVTNRQFERFVKATGYRTLAERPVKLEEVMRQLPPGTPPPGADMLAPGSLVFVMPEGTVNLRDLSQWWRWTPGASWRAPEGAGSSLKGRDEHPVVHLAFDDAKAYCEWAGKRLPTEAEWERAARGGTDGLAYVWGNDTPNDRAPLMRWFANIWQGKFPTTNTGADGFTGTAPVKQYKPNPYGLYDMAGNVWEWTADYFDPRAYRGREQQLTIDPGGPAQALDRSLRRVQRGGSYLCHDSYCTRYRPSARQGSAADSGTSHAGVRCARSIP